MKTTVFSLAFAAVLAMGVIAVPVRRKLAPLVSPTTHLAMQLTLSQDACPTNDRSNNAHCQRQCNGEPVCMGNCAKRYCYKQVYPQPTQPFLSDWEHGGEAGEGAF